MDYEYIDYKHIDYKYIDYKHIDYKHIDYTIWTILRFLYHVVSNLCFWFIITFFCESSDRMTRYSDYSAQVYILEYQDLGDYYSV